MNTIVFGRDKGERSEGRGLFWYCLRDAVTDNKMIPQALSLRMMNLSLYCRNISFLSMCVIRWHDAHLVARIPRYSWIRVYNESKGDSSNFLENDNALSLYCLLKKENNLLDNTSSEQAVDFWPLPLFPPKDDCIHSFWSQNTENKKNRPLQM